MKRGLALLCLATGCAVVAPKAPVLPVALWSETLPPFNAVVDQKTGTLLCVKCGQTTITPKWYRDLTHHDLLMWTCQHCGATWASKVAFPQVVTVP